MNMKENDLNVKHIKLTNGDEIVSMIDHMEGDNVVLEFPLLLNSIQNSSGSYTYYFTKYMPLTDEVIVNLNARNIIAYSDVSTEVEDKYIRAAINYREDKEKEHRKVMQEMNSDLQSALDEMLNDTYYDSNNESQHTVH